ncbi:unnamed protein product [Brachionus calyciflorus]|uniref:Uncharacterized protein n=1 Tax=Brachionus calyciflorus TaxID=104777 RepID=A0A814M8A2_9BILA|nr:unnamed protein product [Brachionus calyciflorus]
MSQLLRSGETSNLRWIFPDKAPYLNKGRGISIMISMFMVTHNETSIFEFSDEEYQDAFRSHSEISKNNGVNYYPRSANAWIEPRKDAYFDNDQILKQFNRLFILIRFIKTFEDHEIDCIVDNA